MIIGICGPITVGAFKNHLHEDGQPSNLWPKGMGGTAVTLLAKGLLAAGEDLCLFSLDPDVTEEVVLTGPRLKICIGPYRPKARHRGMDLFRLERNYLTTAINRELPDIVHAHWTYEFALGALSSEVPTLVTVRDWAPYILKHFHNGYRFIRYIMDWKTFRKVHYLTANSPYIAGLVKRRWHKLAAIIPNPIEDSLIVSSKRMMPSGAPTILSINNGMDPHKNVESLIQGFSKIRHEIPQCRLLLVGENFEPGGKAEVWARKHNLNDGIDYAGVLKRDEIFLAIDKAALLIHPSLEESFGNTLVEAMSRGLPVLAGRDSGAVPWVLNNGKAGILCNVTDPSSIASAAIRVLTSPVVWEECSCVGSQRVRDAFSLTSVVALAKENYKHVLAETKGILA